MLWIWITRLYLSFCDQETKTATFPVSIKHNLNKWELKAVTLTLAVYAIVTNSTAAPVAIRLIKTGPTIHARVRITDASFWKKSQFQELLSPAVKSKLDVNYEHHLFPPPPPPDNFKNITFITMKLLEILVKYKIISLETREICRGNYSNIKVHSVQPPSLISRFL